MPDHPSPSQKKSLSLSIPLAIACGLLLLFGILFLALKSAPSNYGTDSTTRGCTQEAKICPDGTAVGRSGNACEFAQCPIAEVAWKTYENEQYQYSIEYPSLLMPSIKMEKNGTIKTLFTTPMQKENHNVDANTYEVTITIHPAKNGLTLRTWLDQETTITLGGKKESLLTDTIKPYRTDTFDGYTFTGGAETIAKHVFIESGDYYLEFRVAGAAIGSDYTIIPNAEMTFDKMLTTFKQK